MVRALRYPKAGPVALGRVGLSFGPFSASQASTLLPGRKANKTKMPSFMSRAQDHLALMVNALVSPWHQLKLHYIFPPLLLPQMLKKVKAKGIPVTLLAPD